MTPPKMHWLVHIPLAAGVPPTWTSATGGFHGVGCGVQGCGVSTPMAADVALATAGLASDVHIPNGGTLVMPTESVMVASGLPSTRTCLAGSTFKVAGAKPNEQVIIAVDVISGAGIQRPYGAHPGVRNAPSGSR